MVRLLCPRPRRGGWGIGRSSASVVRLSASVRPSVCLMSRTSALTRKPKGLGRRNFAQGYPRSHATPTPTSKSKGQKSRWGGGILWRLPSRTACFVWHNIVQTQAGSVRCRKKVSTVAGRSLARPGTSCSGQDAGRVC